MNVRTPAAWAASMTSITLSIDWKRIAWARAFSSDMWLTPKNWLSPKSRRSITRPFVSRAGPRPALRAGSAGAGGSGGGARAPARRGRPRGPARAPSSRPRATARGRRRGGLAGGHGRGALLRVGDHQRDHAVGLGRALEAVDAVDAAVAHAPDEVVDLRGVLLAAQVEADRLRELRRVAEVPAVLVALRRRGRVAQVDLALLAVGEDPAGRAPDRDPGGHLAIGLVRPVDRDPGAPAALVVQRAVDLVVDLAREDRV